MRQLALGLAAIGSLLGINALLSLYVWAPNAAPLSALVPLAETLVLLWLSVLIHRGLAWKSSVRSRRRRIGTVALGGITGLMLGFSAAEAFFQFYYARHFLPRSDIGMIRGALFLFFGDIGPVADILSPIVFVLTLILLAGVGTAIVAGFGAIVGRLRRPVVLAAVVTLAAVPLAVAAGLPQSLAGMTAGSWFDRADASFVSAGPDVPPQGTGDPETSTAAGGDDPPAERYTFPGLRDRDIYMFAVEAYGYAAFHREHISEQLEPTRQAFAEALREKGYEIRSSYMRSPVAGGYSWLAEATLLSGQWIDSQERFLQLSEADLPTLTGTLHEGGYYTFTVRPGTVHASWPEAWELYRFEEAIVAHDGDFNYVGPWFSYVPVTDQYAIWTGHKRIEELTALDGPAADTPLLAYYQLVSSHTPFNKIPPIIEDWQELGNGDVYNRRSDEIQGFNNSWTGGTELVEGYVAAQNYVFEVLTKYIDELLDHDRSPIIVVFGDHQAQRPIRSPNAALSVPIHVASRDPGVLALFEERGFQPGMRSTAPPPHMDMSDFFPMFAELARTTPGVANVGGADD